MLGIEPITMALLGSGALSALGNFFGGKSQAKAQADANAQNVAMQRETNAQNLAIFHDTRGASGSAILPEYLKDTEGELGGSAAEVAKQLFGYGGGAGARLENASGMLTRYDPALEAGDQTVIDLATGKVGANRRDSLAPVLQARTNLARSRAASINQSLDETLAGLRAMRAGAGFRGASTFDTNRAMAATVGARGQATAGIAQADLDNQSAIHGLNENNLQMLLSSLDLPFQRGQQRLAFNDLPMRSVAQSYTDALSPLNFFRLPGANVPYGQSTQVQPVGNTGQYLGAALAGGAQSIGQYLAQQQLMKQLSGYFGGGAGGGGGGNGDFGGETWNPAYP